LRIHACHLRFESLHSAVGWGRRVEIATQSLAIHCCGEAAAKRGMGWENSVQLKLSTIALACAVAGCAQDVTPAIPEPTLRPDDKAQNVIAAPTPTPGEKAAIALDCSGLLQGWNQCLLTASNTCGSKGYTILDRSDQHPTQPNEQAFTRS